MVYCALYGQKKRLILSGEKCTCLWNRFKRKAKLTGGRAVHGSDYSANLHYFITDRITDNYYNYDWVARVLHFGAFIAISFGLHVNCSQVLCELSTILLLTVPQHLTYVEPHISYNCYVKHSPYILVYNSRSIKF